ncbi:hypothetical protein CDAR_97111 [Caerostris darwini]|uniref:Uncharacterized protein n=1 Tax=Caerostris darwini TaxID=1538125 RepID=A0AAV4QRE4_9ARAC|nr:hypothetical protein CDAR_97111 [Caerostris darwini]
MTRRNPYSISSNIFIMFELHKFTRSDSSCLSQIRDYPSIGALGTHILRRSSSIKAGVSDKPEGEFPRPTKCPGFDWGDSAAFCLAGIGPFQDVILCFDYSLNSRRDAHMSDSGQGLISLSLTALFTLPLPHESQLCLDATANLTMLF